MPYLVPMRSSCSKSNSKKHCVSVIVNRGGDCFFSRWRGASFSHLMLILLVGLLERKNVFLNFFFGFLFHRGIILDAVKLWYGTFHCWLGVKVSIMAIFLSLFIFLMMLAELKLNRWYSLRQEKWLWFLPFCLSQSIKKMKNNQPTKTLLPSLPPPVLQWVFLCSSGKKMKPWAKH